MLRRSAVLLLAAVLAGLLGCQREADDPWPPGSVVRADGQAARALLEGLTGFRGTPAARRAKTLIDRIENCGQVVAEAPAGELGELLAALRCGALEDPAPVLSEAAARDLVFALRPAPDVRLLGQGDVAADGSMVLDLHIEAPRKTEVAALAWPASQAAGPPRLSGAETLVQARFRPAGGLDLAELVPEGGQGDRLFRLKSDLFAGAVLDGAFELVVYLPPEGRLMPPVALALDIASQRLAVAAMKKFVADLAETWSIQPTPFSVGESRGACLLRLNVMPELAPCYVATGDQLVVGWNPGSVRRALSGRTGGGLGADGGLVLHLDRFDEADRRLRRAHAPETPPARLDYAWRKLVARAEPEGDGVRVRIDLPARSPSRVGRTRALPDGKGGT